MEDNLTPYEKNIFSQLKRSERPPADLENKIINRLKSEGIIETKTYTMNRTLKAISTIAAALALFFIGNYFGKQSVDQNVINPELGYMLILHEDDKFTPGDPNVMYKEYYNWMQSTFEKGVNITGQELKNEAVFIGKNTDNKKDGRTTGYFILESDSIETVLEIARSNPHIKYGGSIEVKAYMNR